MTNDRNIEETGIKRCALHHLLSIAVSVFNGSSAKNRWHVWQNGPQGLAEFLSLLGMLLVELQDTFAKPTTLCPQLHASLQGLLLGEQVACQLADMELQNAKGALVVTAALSEQLSIILHIVQEFLTEAVLLLAIQMLFCLLGLEVSQQALHELHCGNTSGQCWPHHLRGLLHSHHDCLAIMALPFERLEGLRADAPEILGGLIKRLILLNNAFDVGLGSLDRLLGMISGGRHQRQVCFQALLLLISMELLRFASTLGLSVF